MAKQKYYAVRKGLKIGIYNTWEECKANVNGYPKAEFKSFSSREEAEQYIGSCEAVNIEKMSVADCVKIYVDGSYCKENNNFSYGMVVLNGECEQHYNKKFEDVELAKMHNVAGEIKGAEAAMRYAVDNNIKNIIIYHDYEGIAKWCTGEWKANKEGTQKYRDYYNSVKDIVNINFVKVKGHSNDKYNDLADKLAKEALGI